MSVAQTYIKQLVLLFLFILSKKQPIDQLKFTFIVLHYFRIFRDQIHYQKQIDYKMKAQNKS